MLSRLLRSRKYPPPPFPPERSQALRRGALLSSGRTFSIYVSHMEKACGFPGLDTDWDTPAFTAASRGLGNIPDAGNRFGNILTIRDLERFDTLESIESEFGLLGIFSNIPPRSLQSEALPVIRASPYGPLLARTPQAHKRLRGLRGIQGAQQLTLEMVFRKNATRSTILTRPRFCTPGGLIRRNMCSIHFLWASAIRHTAPGDLILPSFQRPNTNRILKDVLPKSGVMVGSRYTAHAIRRGDANEISRPGSALATIIRAGGWVAGGYKA